MKVDHRVECSNTCDLRFRRDEDRGRCACPNPADHLKMGAPRLRISYSFHAARGGNGDLLSHSKNRVAPTHPDGKRGSVESGRTWRLKSTWMENAHFVEVERHPLYTRVREIF
jgi:hypothetical protein